MHAGQARPTSLSVFGTNTGFISCRPASASSSLSSVVYSDDPSSSLSSSSSSGNSSAAAASAANCCCRNLQERGSAAQALAAVPLGATWPTERARVKQPQAFPVVEDVEPGAAWPNPALASLCR